MRKLAGVSILILVLSACTTVHAPTDAKRAAELNAQLGLGYLKQGQYKRALHKLDKALKFDSDNSNAHHYKAELYRRLNDPSKAEQEYKIAMNLAPDNLTIQNNYGVFLCDAGKYDEAIALFKKPLADPVYQNKAGSYENIGLCQLRQGKVAKAEKAFIQALKYNPKMPKSLLKMAQIRFDGGNSVAAYSLYSRYLAVAPQTTYKIKLKGKYPDSRETKMLLKLERQGKL